MYNFELTINLFYTQKIVSPLYSRFAFFTSLFERFDFLAQEMQNRFFFSAENSKISMNATIPIANILVVVSVAPGKI